MENAQTITQAKSPAEPVDPPVKDAKIIVLVEELGQLQAKAVESAARQLDLTKEIEAALKGAHEVRQKTQERAVDVGGEG